MRELDNPPRLFEVEDAPAELRAWLSKAKDDVACPAEAEQLAHAAQVRFASSGSHRLRLRRSGHWAGRAMVGLAVVGLGLGGWYLLHGDGHTDTENDGTMHPFSNGPTPLQTPQLPTPPTVTAPVPAAGAFAAEESEPHPSATATHIARTHRREHDTVHRASISVQAEPAPTDSSRTDEFALLRAARQALEDHPQRALAISEEHARRFPVGMLAQERETIAVEALAKLGRTAQAQTRARAFLAAHPESPYKNRIDAALARLPAPQRAP
jgi:hypothetical protein